MIYFKNLHTNQVIEFENKNSIGDYFLDETLFKKLNEEEINVYLLQQDKDKKKIEIEKYYQSKEMRSFKIIKGNLEMHFIINQDLSDNLYCNFKSLKENDLYYTYCIIGTTDSINIPKTTLQDLIQSIELYRKMIKVNELDHCCEIEILDNKPAIEGYNYKKDFRNPPNDFSKFEDITIE